MNKHGILLFFGLFAASFAGCAPITPEDLEGTTLYYLPLFKYVQEPRYDFTYSERLVALKSMKKVKADTLFELIVDPGGKVVKARVLKSHVRECYWEDLESHARRFTFTPDDGTMYRTFYYPMKYRYNSEFEWM